MLLRSVTIDEIFAGPSEDNLAGNADLRIFFEADWRLLLVLVVKYYRHACLGNACLPALVYKILQFVSFQILVHDGAPLGALPVNFVPGLLSCW